MLVVALSKSVRQSTRKVGLVASLVRGRSVADALTILEHTPKRAAEPIRKTIESAKANAENNHDMNVKSLVIAELEIGPAESIKRYRPVAHGRAQPFKRRSTNIKVILEGDAKPAKKATTKKKSELKKSADKSPGKEVPEKVTKSAVSDEAVEKKGFLRKSKKQSSATITKQRTGRRGNR